MSSLPFDIWAHIAKHLPSDSLCRLYGVNKALFKLGLDERYRHLELINRDPSGANHKLSRLQNDQFRAEKVKELTLALHWAEGWLSGYETFDWRVAFQKGGFEDLYVGSRKKEKRWSSKKKGSHPDETELKLTTLQRSLDIIVSLPSLHRCTITDRARDENDFTLPTTAIPFALAAWKASSATLQHLHLDVLAEMLDDLLVPDLAFGSLRRFEVNLSMLYRSTDTMGIVLAALVPFINRHHGLLHTFAFRTKEHLPLKEMFTQLETMPQLRTLAISHGYVSTRQTDTSGLHMFLAKHAETLRTLSLSFHALGTNLVLDPSMTDWSEQPFLRVPYEALSRLSFQFFDFPEGFGDQIPRILDGFWVKSLKALEMGMSSPDLELKEEDLRAIFDKVPAEVNLESISIRVDRLTPALFDTLSERLPRLVDLQLEVPTEESVSTDSAEDTESQKFDLDMLKSRYGERWNLRSFTVSRYQGRTSLLGRASFTE